MRDTFRHTLSSRLCELPSCDVLYSYFVVPPFPEKKRRKIIIIIIVIVWTIVLSVCNLDCRMYVYLY